MAEVYVGTKFDTLFMSRDFPRDDHIDRGMAELVEWGRRFAELGLAPGGAGNLSFRSARGFVVTRTAADLRTLQPADFVEVLATDIPRRKLVVAGSHEPSSESLLHAALYRTRAEVQAVLHGHHASLLEHAERLDIPVTRREQPYGTPEVVAEVEDLPGEPVLFVLRNHGFVSAGRSIAEAGGRVLQILTQLRGRPSAAGET